MPIVISPNKFFAKNQNGGGYLPANAVSQQTTDEQVALIEAKGRATRASIPDDYTELSDNVVNLNKVTAIVPDGITAAAGFQMATFFSGYESTVAEGETSSHVEHQNYISAKIPATSTDYVELCGEGGSGNQRLYAVLDAENKVLFRSSINISGVKKPTMSNYPTAAYVIVNVKKSYTGATYLFVGKTVDTRIAEGLATVYEKKSLLTSSDDLDNVKANGVYRFASASVPSNAPGSVGGLVSVITHDTLTYQVFWGRDFYSYRIHTTNDGWRAWSSYAMGASGDFNNMEFSGVYNFSSGNDHAPVNSIGGILIVDNIQNIVSQTVLTSGTDCYMRYRNSSKIWTNWKKINNESDIANVDKEISEIVKSTAISGVWDVDLSDFRIVYATISSTKKWNVGAGYQSYAVNVQPYSFATITIKAKADATCLLGFMTSKEIGADQSTVTTFANGENGRRTINADETETFTIPSNCTYILIGKKSSSSNIAPVSVSISGFRNIVVEVEKKLREIDYTSVEQNPLRAINSTSSGRDIPQSIAIRNAYKKAHQLLDLPWVALLPYPKTETPNTYAQPGDKIAVPYSSVKEYNKFVGFNVSIRTFMTAVHNPYSLMYTEDALESHQQSAYGIEYHGSNCGPYFGNVCSSFDLFALGMNIPWTTDQFVYLEKIGKLHKIVDQSANGVRLMDIIWEPGHTTLITDILRDERGTPTQITVSEYGPKTTNYTPEQFNERLRTKPGIIYMYMDLYKNLEYSPSEFVAVDGESTPSEYVYNDDICTFAGDYACFNSGEDIYINYTAGNYTQMQVFKGETLIETISLVAADHSVKITPDGYGKYKACLTNGNNNSDYTYFEIVDTTLSASYSNGQLTINFSSANGIPSYAEIVNRAGFTRGFIELDEKAIAEGTITVNPQMILAEQLPGTSLPSTFYPRVLFKGEYGMVANPFYAVQS